MSMKLMLTLLVASLVFIVFPANAQSNPPVPKPRGCGVVAYVGVEINNPFTARRITKTTSRSAAVGPRTPEMFEIVARDTPGRVRIEKHPAVLNGSDPLVLHTRDGGDIKTTHAELNTITMIFDCYGGKTFSVQPGMRTAQLYEAQPLQPRLRAAHPYSFFFTSVLRHNPTADLLAEDLGHRLIDGIDALGLRTTQTGSEQDEWNGKPIRIFEEWLSDDLAVTLIETVIDLKKNVETTSSLIDVRRVEPDASLFAIPPGYKINPTPAEMPYQIGVGQSVPVQPKQ